ncbi:MAG: dockerin type I domain-containing protein, partial [Isosphaeraceae bacterium]
MINSTRRAARSFPARRRVRLGLEPLEGRTLLSGVFAQFASQGIAPGTRDSFALSVHRGDFAMPRGGVLIGFAMHAEGDVSPDQLHMDLTHPATTRARVVAHRASAAGASAGVMIASVGGGRFALQMDADGKGMGPFTMDAFLVGDANGDARVDRQDVRLTRSLLGTREGQPGYTLDADANRDGSINARDLALVLRNLGTATRLHPLSINVGLSQGSDPDGNGVVTRPDVVLVGQTSPGATVQLDQGADGSIDQTTTADPLGGYQFSLTLGIGQTRVQVTTADRFGQQSTAETTLTRGDAVIAWTRTMLDAIRADRSNVGLGSRNLAMLSGAMYDAVNGITQTHAAYHVDVKAPAGASLDAAAAVAAYRVSLDVYPAQKPRFDATLAESLASIPDGPSKSEGIAQGLRVADAMQTWRNDDGSAAQVPYTPEDVPGHWRPTPPDYEVAWGPEWGQVTPFAIPAIAPFLPPPPPAITSPEYAAALNLTRSLGALDSTTRTHDQTQVADFWAYDIDDLGSPITRFEQVVQSVALQQGNTLEQNARLFALANISMADAGIVAWQTKFTNNTWRPITAIRLADLDGNPATVADPTWTPLGAPGGNAPNFT